MMGWTNILGKTVVFAGEAIQRADIGKYLEDRAEDLLENQAKEVAVGFIQRVVRGKNTVAKETITGEFSKIFNNDNFSLAMQYQWNIFEDEICVPTILKIVKYKSILDKGFYALPLFTLFSVFSKRIEDDLTNAKGLDDLYKSAFPR